MTRPLATLVFVLVAVPALALAKPRVALVPLDNDSGGDVQDAVVDALDGGELAVVGPKQVARAADKLGLDGALSEKQLKKLATELEADAVVQASVSNKGSNKVLHFKLFVHGKKQKGFKIEFGSASSKKFKTALHDKMVEKLGDIGGKAGDDDDKPVKKKKGAKTADDDENPLPAAKDKDKDKKKGKAAKAGGDDDSGDDKPVAKKGKKAASDDDAGDDKPVAKKGKKASDDDSGDDDKVAKKKAGDDDSGDDKPKKAAGDDDAAAGDDDKPKKKRTAHAGDDDAGDDGEVRGHVDLAAASDAHAANRAPVRVDAGISITGRSLTWNTKIFTEGMGNPKPYSNSPVPGARVDGAIYPLAISNPSGAVAGLGFAGMYDKTISLGLHNALMPTATYNADEFRWNIGARYRLLFGSKATSPSITFGLDYGHRQFKVTNRPAPDTGIVIDIPDVQYVGITPNVELRVPLAPAVALIAGGGSLLTLKAGSIQNPEQYGQAKVTEFEAMGGLDVVLSKHMALRFTGEFALFGFAFVGNGALANARDGDPSNIDVGGASDRYIGGAATFAVLY